LFNTTGFENTANGAFALFHNTEGGVNTAHGVFALFNNTTGIGNTANGWDPLSGNTCGINNTALGVAAGQLQTTGDGNVYIGANMVGVAGESNACYIRSIFNQTSTSGIPVLINSSNKLGTAPSSQRFKKEIRPMDKASEAILALKPVTFHYKSGKTDTPQFGLIAEEVAEVNPDLITRDQNGNPETVRYDAVNAMLLNEFLKEHRKVQELEVNDAEQQREIKALVATVKEQAAQIQKVSAQLQLRKPEPHAVVNNP
jgi:hypothetical protein